MIYRSEIGNMNNDSSILVNFKSWLLEIFRMKITFASRIYNLLGWLTFCAGFPADKIRCSEKLYAEKRSPKNGPLEKNPQKKGPRIKNPHEKRSPEKWSSEIFRLKY